MGWLDWLVCFFAKLIQCKKWANKPLFSQVQSMHSMASMCVPIQDWTRISARESDAHTTELRGQGERESVIFKQMTSIYKLFAKQVIVGSEAKKLGVLPSSNLFDTLTLNICNLIKIDIFSHFVLIFVTIGKSMLSQLYYYYYYHATTQMHLL